MYSKLYRTIFDGSLYGEFEALTVFMAMLALADRHGEVDAAPNKIAGCLGCSVEFVLKGIDLLEAPDPISRTPAEEGRRLLRLPNDEGGLKPFGWRITNYEKYRSIRNEEERRAYKREWDRENRSKKSEPTKPDQKRPIQKQSAEADTVKEKKGRFAPPSLQEVKAYCKERGNHVDPQSFIDHYEANGWIRGKTKIKSWRACVRTWEKTNKPPTGLGGAF